MKKKRTPNEKPKVVWVGSSPITRISEKQSRELDRRIQRHKERLRKRYPEIHGRIVDYVSHSIEGGTLFVNVVFKDKTTSPCVSPARYSSWELTSATHAPET